VTKDKTKLILKQETHDAYLKNIQIDPTALCPNTVWIFVDDMGYADPSGLGATAIQTPCLDQLAPKSDIKYTIPISLDNPSFAHTKHGPYLFDLWYRDWKRGLCCSILLFDNYVQILVGVG
jgi:hypothetical protein